jgi:hypothetical protein
MVPIALHPAECADFDSMNHEKKIASASVLYLLNL